MSNHCLPPSLQIPVTTWDFDQILDPFPEMKMMMTRFFLITSSVAMDGDVARASAQTLVWELLCV